MENQINDTIGQVNFYKKILLFIVLLLVFMIFLDLLIQSLRFSPDVYTAYLKQSSHLFFVAFFLGIIATAIVQSSSAITTLAVAMVAKGDLELSNAIPIVIGSNIGTTITPFIFSFVHSQRRGQFKRAMSIAFAHNVFNVLTAILLIFVEFKFEFLSFISTWLGHHTYNSLGTKTLAPFFKDGMLAPITRYMAQLIGIDWLAAVIGFIGMYASIRGFVRLFANDNAKSDNSFVNKYIFESPYKTFFTGLLGTAVV
ncbi:MAG TPA: Na/Pi symporter, partial [Cytophagales bacterium]|nr:Na/Pi symporter [Cytophagales bacterium]